MMNMMYGNGGNLNFSMLWTLHAFSVVAFATGLLFLLYVALRHCTEKQLIQWGWTLLIAGSIVCLLTIGAMGHPWYGSGMNGMRGFGFDRGPMMMWSNDRGNEDAEENSPQAKEEAEGKELYEKLQSKQTTCAKLTDSDFELIGEYVMGTRMGGSHESMNERIKQMIGNEGEEQMHIALGKNATGCVSGTKSSAS